MTALRYDQIIGVIGAGTMGAGIAQVAAAAGHPVLLFDLKSETVTQAITNIDLALTRQLNKGKIIVEAKTALLARIAPCHDLAVMSVADLIIEVVVEDLSIKRQLFAELESITQTSTILASNTSSLSITAIGSDLHRPERLVGMHFFNPVPLMGLVEVISGLMTDQSVAATVFDTATAWGKHPVHAKSTPGFIVNRVARPYYAEALRALQEGAADIATLDAVLREAGGFRMGPFELMDLIGLDVNYAVTESVFQAYYQDPRFTPSLLQQELVQGGFLGRKSGRGFYRYDDDSPPLAPHMAAATSPPTQVITHGQLGPLESLLPLLESAGVQFQRTESDTGWLELDGKVMLALSDGRTATERVATGDGQSLVLVDLALDYASATRVALAPADQTTDAELALAVGLFQALGKHVSILDDYPAMIVMRTVCMLANTGADTVNQGVCSAAAVDIAMQKGVNYPLGPLVWVERIGLDWVIKVLNHLATSYGEDRYRVSPWLRRKLHIQSNPTATVATF